MISIISQDRKYLTNRTWEARALPSKCCTLKAVSHEHASFHTPEPQVPRNLDFFCFCCIPCFQEAPVEGSIVMVSKWYLVPH